MADVSENRLRSILENIARDENYQNCKIKIDPISTEGANYSSVLFLATISAEGRDDLKLFAKVAVISEAIRKLVSTNVFTIEKFVYTDLAERYNSIQEKHGVPESIRYVFPKMYVCDESYMNETFILEDLSAQDHIVFDRFKSVDWDYSSAAIKQVAKFHALAFAFREEDPIGFEKTLEICKFTYEMRDDEIADFVSKAVDVVPEKYKERLKKFFDVHPGTDMMKCMYMVQRKPIIVHGDFRPSNILVKYTEGKVSSLIPVDYQTTNNGSPTTDLLYFIFCGTDQKFRRNYFNKLIDLYYETFEEFLSLLDLDSKRIYPRKDFDEDLKERLPFGLVVAAYILPIVMVEGENAPDLSDAQDMSGIIVKQSEVYRERFLGIVEDFIEWGIL